VTTNDEGIAMQCRMLRRPTGQTRKYEHEVEAQQSSGRDSGGTAQRQASPSRSWTDSVANAPRYYDKLFRDAPAS